MKTRLRTAVRAMTRAETVETITTQIADAEAEAREASTEAARQAALARELLDDDQAEAAEARSRSEDRRRRRAEARIGELRERLAAAQWQERAVAFEKHRRILIAAARKAIDAIEQAARANAEIAQARHNASQDLGNEVNGLPLQFFGGILSPDIVAIWRRRTERELAAMDTAELPRPATPRPSGMPQAPYRNPNTIEPAAPVKLAEVVPPAPQPPAPAPKRQQRRDPPPGPGERQVHIMRRDTIDLGDGTQVGLNDRVNLPEAKARLFVERGLGDYVNFAAVDAGNTEGPSAPEKAADVVDEIAPVTGDLRATIDPSELIGIGVER
jgi:hypothetical protein